MKKRKQFDCVQMKWDIQKKIEREFRGIPDDKANKVQMERLSNNSILGPLVKKIRLLQIT